MTLAQIRTDLKNRVAVNSAVNAYAQMPEVIEPPAFVVGPLESVPYNHDFGKTHNLYVFSVRVYVGRVDMDEAMIALDPFLLKSGTSSIKALLDNQTTYNSGSAQWTNVREARDVGVYDFGGVQYVGAEFVVEVLA